MKLLLNRRPIQGQPWGGGNLLVQAFCDYLPSHGIEVTHELTSNIDVIFMQDPRPSQDVRVGINEILGYKHVNPNVKIIHRVNECDARKGTSGMDELLQECSYHTDATVFVSVWMQGYFTEMVEFTNGPTSRIPWGCKKQCVIINGVNPKHFYPREKIDNGKVNIVAHHWSYNRMKGADVYEAIDRFAGKHSNDYEFTYIGRHKCDFKNTTVVPPLHGKALGDELGKHDIYISGTSADPGPNHVLEAIASDLPTYVFYRGGGAVSFAGLDHTFRLNILPEGTIGFQPLYDIFEKGTFINNSLEIRDWKSCVDDYAKLIREII